MARLIPEVFGRSLHSKAESKLAERFRRELPDDCVLMHSVGLVRHSKKRWAEADFVLVGPHGVFCIEVKGGVVDRRHGVWTFTDEHGHTNERHEGPFDQAGGAAGALHGWLVDADVRRDDGSRFQVGYAVMIPDCELHAAGPDIEPELLLDFRHRGVTLDDFVDRIGSHWSEKKKYAPLAPDEVERLAQAIRPDFESVMRRSLKAGLIEDEVIRLTEQQRQVIDGLAENPRVIVRGPAGTGKSMLAVREAMRLAAAGRRTLVVCHTAALAATLAASLDDLELVHVGVADVLIGDVVEQAGRIDELPDATSDYLRDTALPDLAADVLAETGPRFDALVVDEGQDLFRGGSLPVLDRFVRGGLEQGTWRFFLDPNQRIFGPARVGVTELLDAGHPTRYSLRVNCRTTQQITEMATMLSGARMAAESPINGPDVDTLDDWSMPWPERARSATLEMLDRGLSPDDIVVLVPSEGDRLSLTKETPELFGRDGDRAVRVETISDFKGLEAVAVVLAGLRDLENPDNRRAAYVGSTRAKAYLAVALASSAEVSFGERVSDYARETAERIREGRS